MYWIYIGEAIWVLKWIADFSVDNDYYFWFENLCKEHENLRRIGIFVFRIPKRTLCSNSLRDYLELRLIHNWNDKLA